MARKITVAPISLQEARDAAALTLAELAAEAQVSVATVWRAEHGLSRPLPRVRWALSRACGLPTPAHIAWPRRGARLTDAAGD